MKQGLPDTSLRRSPRSAGAAIMALALALAGLGLTLSPTALAQDHALVLVADASPLPPEDARVAFAGLLAELRTSHPTREVRGDPARAAAQLFEACELARCRASLMLRWHAGAVVVVRFLAPSVAPAGHARLSLELFDAGGGRVGDARVLELVPDAGGSLRAALRAGLVGLTLPAPSAAPLLVTCDVAGARVFLDDHPLGVVPLGVTRVALGRHRLHVSAPGYRAHEQTLDLRAAGARVDVRLAPGTRARP